MVAGDVRLHQVTVLVIRVVLSGLVQMTPAC